MLTCKQCGADLTNGEVRKGVSQKTGKPWQGVKCSCGNMEFIPFAFGKKPEYKNPTPAVPRPTFTPDQSADKSSPNTKLELIVKQLNDVLAKQALAQKKLEEIDGKIQALKLSQQDALSVNEEALQWAAEKITKPEDVKWEE